MRNRGAIVVPFLGGSHKPVSSERVWAVLGKDTARPRILVVLGLVLIFLGLLCVYLYELASDADEQSPHLNNSFGFVDLPLFHQQLRFDSDAAAGPVVRLSVGTPRTGLSVGLDMGAAGTDSRLRLLRQSAQLSSTLIAHHADSQSYSDNVTELAFATGTTAPRTRYGSELFATGFPIAVDIPQPLDPFEFEPSYPTDAVLNAPYAMPLMARWTSLEFSAFFLRMHINTLSNSNKLECEANVTNKMCQVESVSVCSKEVELLLADESASETIFVKGPDFVDSVHKVCSERSYSFWESIMKALQTEPRPSFANERTNILQNDLPAMSIRTADLCGLGSVDVVYDRSTQKSQLFLPWSTFITGTTITNDPYSSKRFVWQAAPFESVRTVTSLLVVLVTGALLWRVNIQILPPLDPYKEIYRARLPEALKLFVTEFQVMATCVVTTAAIATDQNFDNINVGFSNMDLRGEQSFTLGLSFLLAIVWWSWSLLVTLQAVRASHYDRIVANTWRRFFVSQTLIQTILMGIPCILEATAGIASAAFVYLLSMHVSISALLAVILADVSHRMVKQYHDEVLVELAEQKDFQEEQSDASVLLLVLWVSSILAMLMIVAQDFLTGLMPLLVTFFPGNGLVFVFIAVVFVLFSATSDSHDRVQTHRYLVDLARKSKKDL